MKKMPCLFVRKFGERSKGHTPFAITEDVTPGCEWVGAGEGVASIKRDGTACMVRDGLLFKRYDAKNGKTPPIGFEPAQEPAAVTGHWPGWIPVPTETDGPSEMSWHQLAWQRWMTRQDGVADGTYELCGPMLQGNPEGMGTHTFIRHGVEIVPDAPRTFERLREFLAAFTHEGLVFAHSDGRMCKIRRDDFGFAWPIKAAA